MSRPLNSFLYGPPDAPTGGTGSMGTEDVIDFFALDNDESDKEVLDLPKVKQETKGSEDKGADFADRTDKEDGKEGESEEVGDKADEKDELAELEEELEGPTDEQLELVTPVRRKEILKKYPELFKDFPYLEKAYYREQQFTELLPTIDDAKIAVQKSQVLDRFEADVSQGNMTNVLQAVKDDNPDGFAILADNYMATLARVDQKAYHHVLGNIMKHTISAMVGEGKRSNNDVLTSAAQILNQFIFASSEFTPPTNLFQGRIDRTQETELQNRQRQFTAQQLGSAVDNMNSKVNNALKNTVDANIDPKSSMTDYVKKTASRDALETLERLISQDSRFKGLADRLWSQAVRDGFTKESVDKIKTAYLAKAKTLLPTVIKKARNDAMRGLGRKVRDDDDTETTSSDRKGPIPSGRPRSSSSSGKITKPSDIPKGMRTIDFLNAD